MLVESQLKHVPVRWLVVAPWRSSSFFLTWLIGCQWRRSYFGRGMKKSGLNSSVEFQEQIVGEPSASSNEQSILFVIVLSEKRNRFSIHQTIHKPTNWKNIAVVQQRKALTEAILFRLFEYLF